MEVELKIEHAKTWYAALEAATKKHGSTGWMGLPEGIVQTSRTREFQILLVRAMQSLLKHADVPEHYLAAPTYDLQHPADADEAAGTTWMLWDDSELRLSRKMPFAEWATVLADALMMNGPTAASRAERVVQYAANLVALTQTDGAMAHGRDREGYWPTQLIDFYNTMVFYEVIDAAMTEAVDKYVSVHLRGEQ